ncbi:MAG: FAD-binding oxidoreductase [Alphaproteobacteria bacterium]|nr:FAD-binding oxidoreductase [Alphaproteobacteria bacterium]
MSAALRDALAAALGEAHVSRDPAELALAGSDVFEWPGAVPPDLLLRPGSAAEAAEAVRLLAAAGFSVVPRGAGLSYTGGAVPHAPRVAVLDTRRLDHVSIDAGDLRARVGAGATWEALAEAASRHGLRAAVAAPISGSHSTIGGAASQNLPGSMEGFIGVEAVLADGSLARAGALAQPGGEGSWRHHGPDLTGLFLGDCGAFGIKTELALRLVPERPAAFASFAFARGSDIAEAMVATMRAGAATRAFALDRLRSEGARSLDAGEAARTLGAVVAAATSPVQALRDAARLAKAGLGGGDDAPWSLHVTAEAESERAAAERIEAVRGYCAAGREVDAVVPRTLRARPFSIRGMVGPQGERWVPVHGILPLSRAAAALAALEAMAEAERAALDDAGMAVNWLVASTGPHVTIEPMFYWPDALDPIHLAHMSGRNRARFGAFAANPSGRALARRLREAMRDALDAHGAVHAQLGRFYRYAEALDPAAAALAHRIKLALDPGGRMNPGVLGLGAAGEGRGPA